MHITHYTGVECNVKCRPHYTLHFTRRTCRIPDLTLHITHYTLQPKWISSDSNDTLHITHYTLHCALSVISYPSHITHYRLHITHYTPYPNHHSNPETCPLNSEMWDTWAGPETLQCKNTCPIPWPSAVLLHAHVQDVETLQYPNPSWSGEFKPWKT